MYRTRNIVSSATIVAQRLPIWQSQGQRIRHLKSSTKDLKRAGSARSVGAAMSLRDMPGPPLFENLQRYWREGMRNYHLILKEGFEKYGPTFKFKLPGNPVVCTCDPDDIEKVFRAEGYPVDRSQSFIISSYFVDEKGLKEGILGNDESWHPHRSAVGSKLLLPIALKSYVSDLCAVADDTISASFNEGINLDILPELMKWSTESIGVVLFDQRIGVNEITPNKMALDFINEVCKLIFIEGKLYLSFPQLYKLFKTPMLKQAYSSLDIMWDTTNHFVQKVREQRTTLASESLVQQLIDEDRLSNDEILQLSVIMFSAGVDTTSNTLLNVLYLLSLFPKVQQKLYEVIETTLSNEEAPTSNHLNNMTYMKAFIKEAIRLQPPTIGNSRKLKEPIVLSGYEVPPGTMILLSSFASPSMDKEIYGEKFENLIPDRWLRGSKKIHPFAKLPFGFGRRMCAGKRVAEMEISLFLIRFLQKYEIEVRSDEEDKMEWIFHLLQHPTKPFNLNLKKRK